MHSLLFGGGKHLSCFRVQNKINGIQFNEAGADDVAFDATVDVSGKKIVRTASTTLVLGYLARLAFAKPECGGCASEDSANMAKGIFESCLQRAAYAAYAVDLSFEAEFHESGVVLVDDAIVCHVQDINI